jgi:hypothetical protein
MKVYDNAPKPGRIWSIEVPARLGRRSLVRIIANIPGVHVTQEPSALSWLRDKPFCRFELGGRYFTIESSWSAGDRFEISPDPAGCTYELLVVRQALLAHPASGA